MANKQKSINRKSRARKSRVGKSRSRKSRVGKSRARKSRVGKSRARKSRVRRTKLTSSMQGESPRLITFPQGTVFYRGTQGNGNSELGNQILWLALDQQSAEIYTSAQDSKLFKYSVKTKFSVYNMANSYIKSFVLNGIEKSCEEAFPKNSGLLRNSTPENDKQCFSAIMGKGPPTFNGDIIGVGSIEHLSGHHPEVALFNGINGRELKNYLNFEGEIKIEEASRRPPPIGKKIRPGSSSDERGGGRTLF